MSQPEAAVAIVHTRSQPETVLLMRRSERPGDSWAGHWSLPGGRCEPADSDLVHTALRELEEECGLRLTERHLETTLLHTTARRKAPPYLLVAPFVFRVDTELPTLLDPAEAVESLWIPVEKLRDPAHQALRPVPGRPPGMLFPCIELQGAPLWGFTYRLLTDWMRPAAEFRPNGAAIADVILGFLLHCGLTLRHSWSECDGVPTAAVNEPIPAAAVLARFSGPNSHVVAINTLDVHTDHIRLLGPAWEEYRIESHAEPRT